MPESRQRLEILLIACTAPWWWRAYAERGPVFVHRWRCPGYTTPREYPKALRERPQVVRAYDSGGRIADADVASSARQGEAAVRGFLARPDVALVQLRNVGYGCDSCAVRATT